MQALHKEEQLARKQREESQEMNAHNNKYDSESGFSNKYPAT